MHLLPWLVPIASVLFVLTSHRRARGLEGPFEVHVQPVEARHPLRVALSLQVSVQHLRLPLRSNKRPLETVASAVVAPYVVPHRRALVVAPVLLVTAPTEVLLRVLVVALVLAPPASHLAKRPSVVDRLERPPVGVVLPRLYRPAIVVPARAAEHGHVDDTLPPLVVLLRLDVAHLLLVLVVAGLHRGQGLLRPHVIAAPAEPMHVPFVLLRIFSPTVGLLELEDVLVLVAPPLLPLVTVRLGQVERPNVKKQTPLPCVLLALPLVVLVAITFVPSGPVHPPVLWRPVAGFLPSTDLAPSALWFHPKDDAE